MNAVNFRPKTMAVVMNNIIRNKKRYYRFFRWHRYYSIQAPDESPDTDELCGFCALLNNRMIMRKISAHEDITRFWNTASNSEILGLLGKIYNLTNETPDPFR